MGLQHLPYESEQRGRAADLRILTERHVQMLGEALGQGSRGDQAGKETDRPSATAGEPVAQRAPPPCSEEQRCKQEEQILLELSQEGPGKCCGCATDTRQQITRERQREERETSRSGSERRVRMGDLVVESEGDGRREKPSCHLLVRRSWRQRDRRGEYTRRDPGSEHGNPHQGPVNVLHEVAEQSDERNAEDVVSWLSLVNGGVAKRYRPQMEDEVPGPEEVYHPGHPEPDRHDPDTDRDELVDRDPIRSARAFLASGGMTGRVQSCRLVIYMFGVGQGGGQQTDPLRIEESVGERGSLPFPAPPEPEPLPGMSTPQDKAGPSRGATPSLWRPDAVQHGGMAMTAWVGIAWSEETLVVAVLPSGRSRPSRALPRGSCWRPVAGPSS